MSTLSLREKLCLDIASLLDDDSYDVLAKVGKPPKERTFRAHSLILRARSEYFKTALSKRWAKQDTTFAFEDPFIKPIVFEILLKYMYTGDIILDSSKVCYLELLLTADRLGITDLVQVLEKHLIHAEPSWLERMVIPIYEIGVSMDTSLKELVSESEKIILANPKIVWDSAAFVTVHESVIIALLQSNDLHVAEVELWRRVLQWGFAQIGEQLDWNRHYSDDNVAQLADAVKNCIPHIRFFWMPSEDYFTRVRPFKGVLNAELVDLLEEFYMVPGKLPPPSIGPPRLQYMFCDSNLLLYQQMMTIAKWIDGEKSTWNYKFRQIYPRGHDKITFDGFQSVCSRQGATLVVIKVAGMDVLVGGYNPLPWKGSCTWLVTEKAFIFSFGFKSNGRATLSRVRDPTMAVFDANTSSKEWVGFGRKDLPLFGGQILFDHVYERKILDVPSFTVEMMEVFSVSMTG